MELIPLFPLEIVVFPGERLNLYIFEPRYKQLINECEEKDLAFGIPFYQKDRPLEYGTMVELVEIANKYDDGRMDIRTVGIKPFQIKRFRREFPDRLYPGGYVEYPYWERQGETELQREILKLIDNLYRTLEVKKLPKEFEGNFTTFEIAHKVGFSQEEEYKFLQIPTEVERQKRMLQHLQHLIPRVVEKDEIRKKVQMNGHFKNLKPPI